MFPSVESPLVPAACLAALLVSLPASASLAQNSAVPGRSNPNLAGRASGYTCCDGDSMPAQQPYLVPEDDVVLVPCASLTLDVFGKVSYEPGLPAGNNGDGDQVFDMTNFGDGISSPLNVRANALVGVFLDDESPTGKPTPIRIDFAADFDFETLRPGLRQIFYIGDARVTDSSLGPSTGAKQKFVVPAGATRLYLGTADGTGWANNSGAFSVLVNSEPYQPPFECGDAAGPDGIFASDSLSVLRAAVGINECPPCLCDVDHSGATVANDALRVLRKAVGQDVRLECACCEQLE